MNLMKDLRDIFMPKRCLHCKTIIPKHISYLCNDCHQQLEFTSFLDYVNNPLEKIFYGKVDVIQAASLYYYKKNTPIQTLLKSLKYSGLQEFGRHSAESICEELKQVNRFKNIDIVIPVPLHPEKEKKRGYNQIDFFAKTISKQLKANYLKNGLIKTQNNRSQTKQNKEERHLSVQNLFKTNTSHNVENKHILLVDDVLTTGATLISCIRALEKLNNVNISIITIACVI